MVAFRDNWVFLLFFVKANKNIYRALPYFLLFLWSLQNILNLVFYSYCCTCSYNLCVLLNWELNKSGLCVLRYLQEIGYTDTIIDVRSARVRSLLGLQPVAGDNDNEGQPALVNGEQQPGKRDSQGKRYVMVRMVIVSAFGEASTPSLIEECVLWEFSLF